MVVLADEASGILEVHQPTRVACQALQSGPPSSQNGNSPLHRAGTNLRQIQHWVHSPTFLEPRLGAHRDGVGARLMQVVGEAGIGFVLARIWEGDRYRERALKRQGGASRRCPICRQQRRRR
jgi:hypothetical protein